MMLPLALCSVISLAIIVERLLWGPKKEKAIPTNLLGDLRDLVRSKKHDEIIGLCRSNNSSLARIVLAGTRNLSKPRQELVEICERVGKNETARMQRFLNTLATIAAISPLLGLLGTVFGMIATFQVIEAQGVGSAAALSGGISEALITTATGLAIAIPSLVFYRFFLGKIRAIVLELENVAAELLDEVQ